MTGFVAVGSFDRGAESVRRKALSLELSARQRAVIATQRAPRTLAMSQKTRDLIVSAEERSRRTLMDSRVASVEQPQERRVVRRAGVS